MSAGCARRSTAVTIPIQSAPSAVPAMRSMTGLGRRRDWSRCRPAVSKRVKPGQNAGADRSTPERSPVAAHMGRLIGDARVVRAIGQAGDGLAAAKEEVGMAWIADGPAAGLLVEFEQGAALAERDDVVEQLRFQLDIEFVGLGKRGVAPYRRPRDPQHVGMGARLARARSGGWRLGAARQPEPVHLADHRIAGDAAKLRGDLARRQPIRPEFLQRFDALIGPGHASNSSPVAAAEKSRQNPTAGLGNDQLARRIPAPPIYAMTVRRTKCRIRRWKSYNMAGVRRKSPTRLLPHLLSASSQCVHTYLRPCALR